ncbi:MAG: hypothetical protein HDT42_06810 [Ruminococcaceae bacterium]|nr:hypothetical protein [Oscillospiraceae bacterium]
MEDDVSVGLVGVVAETVDWGLVSVDVDVSASDSLGAGSGTSRDCISDSVEEIILFLLLLKTESVVVLIDVLLLFGKLVLFESLSVKVPIPPNNKTPLMVDTSIVFPFLAIFLLRSFSLFP